MTVYDYRKRLEKRREEKFYEFIEPALEIWESDAAMGYAMAAAQQLQLPEGTVRDLLYCMKGAFDEIGLDEAAKAFRQSRY